MRSLLLSLLATLFLGIAPASARAEGLPAAIFRAPAAPPVNALVPISCVITETIGRRQEKYTLRLPLLKGEIPLRLFPLVVANVETYSDSTEGPVEINITVLDNSIEDAELLLDLMVGRAKGEDHVSLYVKLDRARRRAVTISCNRE